MNSTILCEVNGTFDCNDNISSPIYCPIWTKHDRDIVDFFEYWFGGVAVCCLSVPGIILNLTAIFVLLTRVSINTTFNSLLISLFSMDSFYLFFETIETFRRRFHLETKLHTILVPKLTYPMIFVSLSASIFMTVGVAHERYAAIKRPIQHRQFMTSAKYRRKQIVLYVLTVCLLAIVFNMPKFFEIELKWNGRKEIINNETKYRYQ